ncbi:hypothetical protein MRS44_017609 [Fusarium solani]|uniref:uncharacterized protein n=1 Tax=Fusarium solani TaxID=169388 RepID=UPI0032C491E3|nr:hypothetical protein MRS44_017609 [Fusarium solani]
MSSASPAPLLSEPSDELLGPASPGSPVPAKRTLDRSPSDRAGKRAKGRTNKSTWNEARGPYEERGESSRYLIPRNLVLQALRLHEKA